MPTLFPGATRANALNFTGEAIRTLREDPNPSRFGPIEIDLDFCRRLATEGQLEDCGIRKDSAGDPILFFGHRRKAHILYINDHPEHWPEWGLAGPMSLRCTYHAVTFEEALEMSVSENVGRAELDAADRAQLARHYSRQGLEPTEIGKHLRVGESRVRQLLDLFSLGDDVLRLIKAGKMTDSMARSMKGLPPETVADVVEKIKAGEGPHAVLAEIRQRQRNNGTARPRSGREIVKAVDALPSGPVRDLLHQWLTGQIDSLETTLRELGVRL
jgi:hypothetical protein